MSTSLVQRIGIGKGLGYVQQDIARLAIQSAVAGGLASFAVAAAGTGEAILAVISAVLVLQRDRDATLANAAKRLGGAAVGTIVGIAAVLLFDDGFIPWPLAVSMLVMGAIAAWKPSLHYGIVAAAGLAAGTGEAFSETLEGRVVAIFGGALIGIAVGWGVFPESAPRRARRQIAKALGLCGELLESMLVVVLESEQAEVDELHARFARTIASARETVAAVRIDRGGERKHLQDAVHGAERLWHALIILDRVSETAPDEGVPLNRDLQPLLHDIRTQASRALERLGHLQPIDGDTMEALQRDCRAASEQAGRRDDAVETVALVFGLSEVSRNLGEINAALERAGSKRPAA